MKKIVFLTVLISASLFINPAVAATTPPKITTEEKNTIIANAKAAGEQKAAKAALDYTAHVMASAPAWARVDNNTLADYLASQKVFADEAAIAAFNASVSSVATQYKVKITSAFDKQLKTDQAAGSKSLANQVNNLIKTVASKFQYNTTGVSTKGDPRIVSTLSAAKQIAQTGTDPINATLKAIDDIYGPYNRQLTDLYTQITDIEKQNLKIINNSKLTYNQKYQQLNTSLLQEVTLISKTEDIAGGLGNNTVGDCYGTLACRQRTEVAKEVLKGAFNINTKVLVVPAGALQHVLLQETASKNGNYRFIDPSAGTITVGPKYGVPAETGNVISSKPVSQINSNTKIGSGISMKDITPPTPAERAAVAAAIKAKKQNQAAQIAAAKARATSTVWDPSKGTEVVGGPPENLIQLANGKVITQAEYDYALGIGNTNTATGNSLDSDDSDLGEINFSSNTYAGSYSHATKGYGAKSGSSKQNSGNSNGTSPVGSLTNSTGSLGSGGGLTKTTGGTCPSGQINGSQIKNNCNQVQNDEEIRIIMYGNGVVTIKNSDGTSASMTGADLLDAIENDYWQGE